MRQILRIFSILFCLLPAYGWAANYTVSTSNTLVDGDTFCSGSTCTSADTIIIDGGARGSLMFRDFDGSGSYITITNEDTNPDSKVVITGNGANGSEKILYLQNCKYVDLRGNNDNDLEYGIKVINDGSPTCSGTVWVFGESEHIKLSYLEIAFDGNTSSTGGGIQINDAELSEAWTFTDIEIHHNYIHDTRYAGMYLGHNNPPGLHNPYIAGFSVHDNILEDLGAYGITLKGINGPNNYIYNNIIQGSLGGQSTGFVTLKTDDFKHGIATHFTYGSNYVEIYNNRIDKTVGPGMYVESTNHLVHDNIICGCGSGNHNTWGNGITTTGSINIEIYDNIIIQPKRYGIYGGWTVTNASHKRNLIGDPGIGEAGGSNLVEGSDADANIYYSNVTNFNFNTWSDDTNYTNDRFRTWNLSPNNNGSGISLDTNLTWENFGDITGVDIFFEKDDATPDVKVVDNANVEEYNPPGDLDYDSTYYWQAITYGGIETGAIYSFTTTSQMNPPTPKGAGMKWTKKGVKGVFHKKGVSIK